MGDGLITPSHDGGRASLSVSSSEAEALEEVLTKAGWSYDHPHRGLYNMVLHAVHELRRHHSGEAWCSRCGTTLENPEP